MPRLIAEDHCPHCRAKLPVPKPRACPRCAASLNQRYLRWGCLSSAPPLILLALCAWRLLRDWM
jgi:predicted amidophosphoribosyltransferase